VQKRGGGLLQNVSKLVSLVTLFGCFSKFFSSWSRGDSSYACDGLGGESTVSMELTPWLPWPRQEIHRSEKDIKAFGIIYEDLGVIISFGSLARL